VDVGFTEPKKMEFGGASNAAGKIQYLPDIYS
jgi:hypothetical protein